jgi:predicted metalloprotease with PDZ domain
MCSGFPVLPGNDPRMKFNPAITALATVVIAGCTTAPRTIRPASAVDTPAATAPNAAPSRAAGRGDAPDLNVPSIPTTLEAYEVKESAFSDFGMSVKTNFDVKWGGTVEWMLVTAVAAGSSAARMGIVAGDRIMAIDGRRVTDLDRDAMLDLLFQRKKGDTSRLLVFGQKDAFPRFVILAASRPGA